MSLSWTIKNMEKIHSEKVVPVKLKYKHDGSFYSVRMQGTGLSRTINRIGSLANNKNITLFSRKTNASNAKTMAIVVRNVE